MSKLKYIEKIRKDHLFISRDKKEFFEGWYFKSTFKKENFTISFIPGISKNSKEEYAFIQVIHSEFGAVDVQFPIHEFSYSDCPFEIKIGNNKFSKDEIVVDINHKALQVTGVFEISNNCDIVKTNYSPNIMGPLAYLQFLECMHGVISLKSNIVANINIQGHEYTNITGNGYIEKDRGTSFPSKYLWAQCNNFVCRTCNIFFAIATVPILLTKFTGHICIFKFNNTEYRFATYNLSKAMYTEDAGEYIVEFKKGKICLKIKLNIGNSYNLKAPSMSKMDREIKESLMSKIELEFYENNVRVFYDESDFCAMESVIPK